MSKNSIVHFEELWEAAEKVSSRIHSNTSVETLKHSLTELLAAYASWDAISASDEIKTSLKKRTMGEILFVITALSSKDNIDVYSALKEQVFLNELPTKG